MHTLRHHPLLRRLIGVLLLALWLAQGTALVHAVAHAPGLAPGLVAPALQSATGEAATAGGHWGHPAGAPQCQVFEGLLLGQAPGGDALSLAPCDLRQPLLAAAVPMAPPLRIARSYQARAPPRG